MKKILLVLAGITMVIAANAQNWNYAVALGGRSSVDGLTGIARDANGNMYITGEFEGTRPFGSGTMTAVGFSDLFLAKYSAAGVYQWSIQIGGTNNVMEAGGVAVDNAGNVYITGNFSFNANFSGNTLSANGSNDAFLAKYDASGNYKWVRALSSPGFEKTTAIQSDGTGMYITGAYTQAMTVNSVSFAAPTGNLEDAFLLKTDTSGTAVWGLKAGGSYDDRGTCLSVSANTIFWGGYFRGLNANFNGTMLSSGNVGYNDMFIVKLNSSGVQQWAKKFGGVYAETMNGVSQNIWGDAVCIGNFYGTVVFGTGMQLVEAYGSQPPAGNGDACVFKISGVDGTCQWVRQIRSNVNFNEVASGVSTDPGGSAYVTGTYNDVPTIFGATATQTGTSLTGVNGTDAYLAKYNLSGGLVWVIGIGGQSNDRGKSVLWDVNGFCNLACNFGGTITLGSNVVTSSPGAVSSFIARYDGLTAGINDFNSGFEFGVFPNPVSDFITITSDVTLPLDKIEIYSVMGAVVMNESFPVQTTEVKMNISDLTPGIYFVHVMSGDQTGIRKIKVN